MSNRRVVIIIRGETELTGGSGCLCCSFLTLPSCEGLARFQWLQEASPTRVTCTFSIMCRFLGFPIPVLCSLGISWGKEGGGSTAWQGPTRLRSYALVPAVYVITMQNTPNSRIR